MLFAVIPEQHIKNFTSYARNFFVGRGRLIGFRSTTITDTKKSFQQNYSTLNSLSRWPYLFFVYVLPAHCKWKERGRNYFFPLFSNFSKEHEYNRSQFFQDRVSTSILFSQKIFRPPFQIPPMYTLC